MISTTTSFKWLWVQDVHFGVPTVPVGGITESFKYVYEEAKRKGIKTVVFGGDITDRPLSISDPYGPEYVEFVVWLLNDAQKNDIAIIIIEGTKSHDWGQGSLFESIKRESNIDVDLLYVDKLSIVTVNGFGNVLIVPDQWRTDASVTFNEVKQLLKEKGLEKVHYAFMHGSFRYQVPKFLRNRVELHDEEAYCSVVEKAILIGHEHSYSKYKIINCAGSLDRHKHGQEEEKGGFFGEQLANGNVLIEFIRNAKSQIFKDVPVDETTSDGILKAIRSYKIDLGQPCNIRLIALKDVQVVSEFIKKYKYEYPMVKWSVKNMTTNERPVDEFKLEDVDLTFNKVILETETLTNILKRRIEAKYPERCLDINSLLDEVIMENE